MNIEYVQTLIQERRNIIAGRHTQIAALHLDIDRLKAEIRGLELAIGVGEKGKRVSDAPGEKYAGMGPTDAVLAVVRSAVGIPLGLTVREIVAELRAAAYKTESKDLYNTIYPIALGLVKQGRLKEGKKDEKRSFLPGDKPDK
jgi:hypothetical protein